MNRQATALTPGDDSPASFLTAVETAYTVMMSQEASLVALGCNYLSAEVTTIKPLLADLRRTSPESQIRMLKATLDEIARRQDLMASALRDIVRSATTEDAIVSAAHRIITNLDVALCCAEEVAEIAALRGGNSVEHDLALEGAGALRMAVQYVTELNELASLHLVGADTDLSTFAVSAPVARAIRRLQMIAQSKGVVVQLADDSSDAQVTHFQGSLEKCVHYLLLAALTSEKVTEITCRARVSGASLLFEVSDNGGGEALSSRADAATAPATERDRDQAASSADGAGYALVRRLARSVGGSISLDILPGIGTLATLTVTAL